MSDSAWGFETRAIHAGQDPDEATGRHHRAPSIWPPPSCSQRRDSTRATSTPGRRTPPGRRWSAVWPGWRAHGTASRSQAVWPPRTRWWACCAPATHVVLGNDAYGGTFRLIARVYGERGIEWSAADLTDVEALADALRPETRQVWVETPTNPMLVGGGHRGCGRRGPLGRGSAGGGQHLRHAVLAEPSGSGCRRGGPLQHQVPGRALRRGRRLHRGERRRAGRAAGLRPERGRGGAPARSTAICCCGASRPWSCAWTATATTPRPWPSSWRTIGRWTGCCTRACRAIPATRSPPARCAASAGWCRASCEVARPPPWLR